MITRNIGRFFRLNHLRNHYKRFGREGIAFYFKQQIVKNKKDIIFRHPEFSHPIHLRPHSSDIDAFYEVIFNLNYNIPIKTKPLVILDLGANIGLASVYFLNKYPQSTVLAIEPEESNFKILQLNTQGYINFKGYQKAIWNKPAFLEINKNELGYWAFSVSEISTQTKNSTEAITIDQLIKIHSIKQIDILKIDIEGSEFELFSSNYETWLPMTKIIIIELHDWMREGCSKKFFSTLINYDFKLSHKGENLICYLK